MGRGITILLAISLGLNFFMAGYLVSDWLKPGPPPVASGFKGFDHPRGLVRMSEALPPDRRRAFRQSFREGLPNMRAHHRDMRALRDEMRVLLKAEEFDSVAAAAKMAEMRDARARQHEAFDEALLSAISVLSADERQAMIEMAQQLRKERPYKRREHTGPPPPQGN